MFRRFLEADGGSLATSLAYAGPVLPNPAPFFALLSPAHLTRLKVLAPAAQAGR